MVAPFLIYLLATLYMKKKSISEIEKKHNPSQMFLIVSKSKLFSSDNILK